MTIQAVLTNKSHRPAGLWRQLCRSVAESYERGRQRRALAMLSDAGLQDIGLTRHDVRREATKSFWQA